MRNTLFLFFLLYTFHGFTQIEEPEWSEKLNSARNANNLCSLEKEVVFELNKVRSNPQLYSKLYIEPLYSAYSGKTFTYPGQKPTLSKEGNGALMECIAVLRKTDTMPILEPADGLIKSARLLVDDQQFGGIGHITRNGLTPQCRMDMYGEWDIASAENIAYGDYEARQIVIALLIDDGVPDRGHRKNILNPKFHNAGVASGRHPTYKTMCVIDFAGAYKSK